MGSEERERRMVPLAVAVGVVATLLVVPLNYAASVHGRGWRPTLPEYGVALVATYATLGLLAYAGWRASGRGPSLSRPTLTGRDAGYAALGAIATVAGGSALVVLVQQVGLSIAQPNLLAPPLEGFASGPAGPERLLAVLPLLVLVVVPVEEVLFRTVVQRCLERALAPQGALTATSVLFALFTAPVFASPDPLATLVPVGIAFGLSLGWGWLYRRTGTVIVPIIAHATPYVVGTGALALLASLARG